MTSIAEQLPDDARPTRIRYFVVFATFLTAVLLYLDRFCMNFAQRYVKEDLGLTDQQVDYCMSAFFLTYALAQVPSGGLTDRFGPRRMLTWYVLAWSLFTAAMGWVGGFVGLMLVRMAAGISQAGAYPTAARIVGHWVPFRRRGLASSAIALGGRVGGAAAPLLTALLVIAFVPSSSSPALTRDDLLDLPAFCEQVQKAQRGVDESATREEQATATVARGVHGALPPDARAVVQSFEGRVSGASKFSDGDRALLVDALNAVIAGPLVAPATDLSMLPLEREAKWLLERTDGLSTAERSRLNRLVLEAVFPHAVRKLYVQGWRPVMLVYGAAGLIVAAWFFWQVRDAPEEHPHVNAAERSLIAADRPVSVSAAGDVPAAAAVPMGAILRSRSLWALNVTQFGTNIGWAFLVTLLDRYLFEVHRAPYVDRSVMQMVPLFVGWAGMLSGGWLTDRLAHRLGLRAGRALPMGLSRFAAAGAYLLLLVHPSVWTCTILFACVAFSTDFGSPSVWAYYQDVGGRSIAAVLGWGNMWGNLGAMASPLLIGWIARTWSWDAAFVTCAAAFVAAGVCGLAVDATQPIAAPTDPDVVSE
jgi:sugar phosphate permease